MDLSDKGSGSEEVISGAAATPERFSSEIQVKTCVDCGATKTPLWRGGPAGPKSLCNACGIRNRKKRRALLGLKKEDKKTKKSSGHKKPMSPSCTSSSGDSTSGSSNVDKKNPIQWTKLGEVEQAAFMLMSLSCSSVYA